MKAIKCELCGSNDVVKQDGLYVCQHCGTKYTVEEAKKLMIDGIVDVQGTVKIDSSSELQNLYKLAQIAKIENNYENAEKYYNQILIKDPNSWEANYYAIYFKSMTCKIAEISKAARNLSNCLQHVLTLVNNIQDLTEQREVVEEIFVRNDAISQMLFNAAIRHFDDIDVSIRDKYVDDHIDNIRECSRIMNAFAILLGIFEERYADVAVKSRKAGINIHKEMIQFLTPETQTIQVNLLKEMEEEIKKYDSSYKLPYIYYGKSDSGCYVATAVYGSYNCPQVWTLRRFRDNTLDETWYGRAFIKTYYAISPTLVEWFGETYWFKKLWRKSLDRLVARLRKRGVEDTPYQDKY